MKTNEYDNLEFKKLFLHVYQSEKEKISYVICKQSFNIKKYHSVLKLFSFFEKG